MALRVKTGISGAFWCDPRSLAFHRAKQSPNSKALCWLDELLGGGLLIPESPRGGKRALTMLLTGPPGTGKSTLATELCYRWAKDPSVAFRCYYATTEAHPPWLIENAQAFWGKKVSQVVGVAPTAKVVVEKFSEPDDLPSTEHGVPKRISALSKLLGLRPARTPETSFPFNVVVVDSLNVMSDRQEKVDIFKSIIDVISDGPDVAIFVLDSQSTGPSSTSEFWEYFCDIVIRLDHTRPTSMSDGYLIRTLEIIKARYQQHAWGPHQLKIYERQNVKRIPGEQRDILAERRTRAHPYRIEGGIFIYPSIHYLLSQYKRRDPSSTPKLIPPPIASLAGILDGGFPEGRCTAFLGERGGHKSYLGFMHVLDRVLNFGEAGLVVSLRDDVGITIASMNRILKTWADADDVSWPERRFEWVEKLRAGRLWGEELQDRLEIMYFPPGNITPEEFMHRVYMSVLRLRKYRARYPVPITFVFNSLDQLRPRFPLCHNESIFIAALLQLLSGEGVTSIFVSASGDEGGTLGYHGLDSIAELILDFKLENLGISDRKRFEVRYGKVTEDWAEALHVMVRVVRHAGGHAAGAFGLLELVDTGHPLRTGEAGDGLQFFPMSQA